MKKPSGNCTYCFLFPLNINFFLFVISFTISCLWSLMLSSRLIVIYIYIYIKTRMHRSYFETVVDVMLTWCATYNHHSCPIVCSFFTFFFYMFNYIFLRSLPYIVSHANVDHCRLIFITNSQQWHQLLPVIDVQWMQKKIYMWHSVTFTDDDIVNATLPIQADAEDNRRKTLWHRHTER